MPLKHSSFLNRHTGIDLGKANSYGLRPLDTRAGGLRQTQAGNILTPMLSKTAFPAEEMEVARAIDAIGGVYLVSLRRHLPYVRACGLKSWALGLKLMKTCYSTYEPLIQLQSLCKCPLRV